MERAMPIQQTILWTGISVIVGVICLGAVAPQYLKAGQAGSSIETSRNLDNAPMVLIPAGPFTMGSDDGPHNERPAHTVTLDAYSIDRYEVTLSPYRKFLEEGKYDAPPTWDDEAATSVGDRPAIGMRWESAAAYCRWAGKRLPTEAEWEKAARGTDGRRYPWGEMQPFVDIANYNRGMWVSEAITLMAVTGGLEGMSVRHGLKEGGKSPFGVFHMAGNAAEWVADWYERDYYQKSPERNPSGPMTGEKRVLRGGSWADVPSALRTTARFQRNRTSRIGRSDFAVRRIGRSE
jgi:formylglycine-generating enzyme required for sulfatase activity